MSPEELQAPEERLQTHLFPAALAGLESLQLFKRRLGRLAPTRMKRMLRPLYRTVAEVLKPPYQVRHLARTGASGPTGDEALVVMSANLWHDWPRYRRLEQRLEAFSELALRQGADILLLQEVASTPEIDSLEILADYLGMGYVYTRANGNRRIGFEEGLAIFSRFPLSDPGLRRLGGPAAAFEHRMALGAQVLTPWGSLRAYSVHLGLGRQQNRRQLQDLRAWVRASLSGQAAVVGGDFNAAEDAPHIREASRTWIDIFRASNPTVRAATHTLRWPWGGVLHRARLDYLFLIPGLPGWQVLDAGHTTTPQRPHSDHCAVVARLQPLGLH